MWDNTLFLFSFRIFSSNLKERMAQRFYNLVLLPRVRDDIAEYKKLNFHLYSALKKALFKPGAWFKGKKTCHVYDKHRTHELSSIERLLHCPNVQNYS